jgi:aminopeptidase N
MKKEKQNKKRASALTILLILVAGFCWFWPRARLVMNGSLQPWNDIRLPPHIRASKYSLNFTTDLLKGGFQGTNQISLTFSSPGKFIIVHGLGLEMDFTQLSSSDEKIFFEIASTEMKPEFQYTIIHLAQTLPVGEYVLSIKYTGRLSTGLAGYYLSTYYLNETPRSIATTQFEPTDARRAFPCLDEPDQKATFKVCPFLH